MSLFYFKREKGVISDVFIKSVSFVLAFLLFLAPLQNYTFAYDFNNAGSHLSLSGQSSVYSPSEFINLQDGSFSQEIALALPPGRLDQLPVVSLQYSSNNKSDGVLGYSWDLTTISIERYHKNGIDKLYDADASFRSSLDGELVSVGNDEYRPKLETGNFRKYQKSGDVWTVTEKDGTTYIFDPALGGEFDSSDSSRIGKWFVTSQLDTNGNTISYSYDTSSGLALLEEISYVETGGTNFIYVQFNYETRPDVISSYRYNFLSTLTKRLSDIAISITGLGVVKSYNFGYKAGQNGTRSLLESVTEDGVRLTHQFEYSQHQPGWTISSSHVPSLMTNGEGRDTGYRLADINGDGRVDQVRSWGRYQDSNFFSYTVNVNTSSGWLTDSSYTLPTIGGGYGFLMNDVVPSHYSRYRDGGGRFADVNGDGFDDILWASSGGENTHTFQVDVTVREAYINNKDGTWTIDQNYTPPNDILFTSEYHDSGTRLIDLNGDGLVDLYRINNDGTNNVDSYLNTGTGWQSTSGWSLPQATANHTYILNNSKFADINNDGLIDLLIAFDAEQANEYHVPETINEVYLNTGSGWQYQQNMSVPINFKQTIDINGNRPINTMSQLSDINADGLVDLISRYTAYHNGISADTAHEGQSFGWVSNGSLASPEPFGVKVYQGYYPAFAGTYVLDVNGDMVPDYLRAGAVYPGYSGTTDQRVRLNTGEIPDLLVKVTNQFGGETEVTYQGIHEQTDLSGNYKHTNPNNRLVVSEEKRIFQPGNEVVISYQYEGADFYFDEIDERYFSGFQKVIQTSELGKKISYYHQGNGVSTTTEEGFDSEALIGKVYRTEVTDLNDNLFQLNRYNFATTSLGNGSTFVKIESDLSLKYDGDSDFRSSANSYTYDNNHGSLLNKTEWGEVNGSTDGSFTDIGNDKRTIENEYATNANGLVLPSKKTLKDNANNKVQESLFYYDNQALGSVTLGNKTKQEDWIQGSNYAERTWTYNNLGLVTSETDGENNTTSYTYDAFNLYPTSITNALNQTTDYEYDYSSGKVATTTDPNGNVFATTYDALDRPLSITVPDPQTGMPVLQSEYVYTDTRGAVSVQKISHLNDGLVHNSYTFLDGFGRKIQERQEAENVDEYVVRDFIYGNNGLLEKESLPYFGSGTVKTSATANTDLLSTFTYDPLGRMSAVGTVLGTTTTSYDQWKETIIDTAGNEKDFTYDAHGRLVQVTEHEGSNNFDTNYSYDEQNNLTRITDAEGNVRNIIYNGLGRRTSLEDLHAPSDNTFGVWTFAYDNASNLISTVDPNDQTINYTYDALNRKLTENYTGQTGTEVTYTYDTCTNGIGQLCSVSNSSVTTEYTYKPNNLLASEAKTIDATTYTTSYDYDRQGNQTLITYPDNSEVKYTFNKGGKVEKIEQKENGGTFADIIVDTDYGPHGQVEYIQYGNGTESTRSYNPAELYRLQNIYTTANSTYGTGGPGEDLRNIEAEMNLMVATLPEEEETVIETTEIPVDSLAEDEIETQEDVVEEDVIEENVSSEVEADSASTSTLPAVQDEEVLSATIATDTVEVVEEVIATTSTSTSTSTTSTTTADIPPATEADTALVTGTKDKKAEKTKEVVFGVSEDIASSTSEFLPIDLPVSPETTPQIAEEVKEEVKEKSKIKVKLNNAHEARMWQKYHQERIVGMKASGADIEAVASAEYAQAELEKYLIQEGFVNSKGDSVKSHAKEYAERKAKKFLEKIVDVILPETAESYLFNTEDFENCSALPCSFDNNLSWGSVTPSLDSTGKVEGDDSLRETVTGSGGGGLEFANQNEDEIYAQFKVFIPSDMTFGASGFYSMIRLEDLSDNSVFWMNVENWGTARLTMMGDTLSWTDTGLDLVKGAVNTIEVRFKKGSTDGDVDVWLNNTNQGSPDYDGSGSLNTGTDNVDDIQVGVTYAPEAISTTYFDDVAIDTAFIGTLTSGNPSVPFVETVQDLTYTYDSVGNITEIIDNSDTASAGTINYAYDDLYRLTSASTTLASTTPYRETYLYNSIGNILYKSDVGAYTYDDGQNSISDYYLYDDSLASGWADWSWWTTINPSDTTEVLFDTHSLSVSYSQPWAGMSYHHNNFDSSDYSDLELSVYTSASTDLYLYLTDQNGTPHQIVELKDYAVGNTLTPNTWHTLTIPLSNLNYQNYQGATELNIETSATSTIYIDNLKFTANSGGGATDTYTNPHAATTIAGVTQTYDKNGNLLTTNTTQNTWNYKNQLIGSSMGVATTTYAYDHNGQRVKKTTDSTTTFYPFSNYQIKDGEVTKHIYQNNTLVATIEADTPAPKVYYNHVDHLGSTNVVTDNDGYINQVLSYYPYGNPRIDNQYDTVDQTKRYTGHEFDEETSLSYMGARYQSGDTGRFTSQDPVSLALGDWGTVQDKTDGKIGFYLQNPQTHNSYSYVFNNPIKFVDQNGEFAVQLSFNSGGGLGATVGSNHTVGFASDGSYGYTVTPYAGGLVGGKLSAGLQLGVSTVDTWAGTEGTDLYTEFGATALVGGVDGGFSISDDKSLGVQIGVSVGPETPVYAGAGVGESTVIVDRNVFDDIASIAKSLRNILRTRYNDIIKNLSVNNSENDENND